MNTDKYKITKNPVVTFDKTNFDKKTNCIRMKMPNFVGMQLRKYRIENGMRNFFYIDAKSSSGEVVTFTDPKTSPDSIDYTNGDLRLVLED